PQVGPTEGRARGTRRRMRRGRPKVVITRGAPLVKRIQIIEGPTPTLLLRQYQAANPTWLPAGMCASSTEAFGSVSLTFGQATGQTTGNQTENDLWSALTMGITKSTRERGSTMFNSGSLVRTGWMLALLLVAAILSGCSSKQEQ